MNRVKYGVVLLLVCCVIVVVFQNTDAVECRILFFTVNTPKALLLFGMFGLGCVVGMLATGRILRPTNKAGG